MRWELTFLPFLFQLTLGLGSPVAWHTNETTPPETPIWSTGTLVNRGGTVERTDKEEDIKTWQEEKSALLQWSHGDHSTGAAEENLRSCHTANTDSPIWLQAARGRHLRLINRTCYFYLSGNPLNHWDYWGDCTPWYLWSTEPRFLFHDRAHYSTSYRSDFRPKECWKHAFLECG